jgi:hypothetical protein
MAALLSIDRRSDREKPLKNMPLYPPREEERTIYNEPLI